ncbi:MAG: transposase [Planctomycetes bacterium]|nr:transposase [Planctomycetota bacterium]
MDRCWFLTWTTYGTWLPGDGRGSVTTIRDEETGERFRPNEYGTPYLPPMRELENAARGAMRGNPVWLTQSMADAAAQQFVETGRFRGWTLLALAVMANHVHVVVGVMGDPDPAHLLRDFKSYGSRTLNRKFGVPESGTWWTTGGSKRILPDENAVSAAVSYVLRQEHPLVLWNPQDDHG